VGALSPVANPSGGQGGIIIPGLERTLPSGATRGGKAEQTSF